jgi:hypothetical protein
MAILYLPRITESDHNAIYGFINNHPAHSYDKWLYLQDKESADWEGRGGEVILVDCSADDFIRYARETGARNDIHILKAVAFAKGIGKFK